MAHAPEEEIAFGGEAEPRWRNPLSMVRGIADWLLAVVFFAVVSLAALPMGGNRDWAWSPVAVIIGVLAVAVALGLGSRSDFEVIERERRPLLALVACFAVFVLFGLFQM